MTRFHIHVAVEDLDANITFYSKLFGQAPDKQRQNYAKWMLDDPRLNFAISRRGHSAGLNHFGMEAESAGELADLKARAESASGIAPLEQQATRCCHAHSEKHWITDPQGLAWEHFLTLSDAAEFGEDNPDPVSACCIPLHPGEEAESPCCVPENKTDEPYCK